MHFYRGNIRRKRRMLKLQRSPRGSFFSYIFVNKITNSLKNAKPKSQVIAFYPLKLSRRSSHAGAWIETSSAQSGTSSIGVAPHAGAWIETTPFEPTVPVKRVAPHAGAWIETSMWPKHQVTRLVAPHAGAWIETLPRPYATAAISGRAPRGRVRAFFHHKNAADGAKSQIHLPFRLTRIF